MSNETRAILAERGKTNGDYGLMSEVSQGIKSLVVSRNTAKYAPYMQESLDMIAHKLARIAAGDAFTEDHWRDIAGYATLAADRVAAADNAAAVPFSARPYTVGDDMCNCNDLQRCPICHPSET